MADITGMTTIQITDIENETSYTIACAEAAKDSTDRSAYLECARSGRPVQMGHILATPVNVEFLVASIDDARKESDNACLRAAELEGIIADAERDLAEVESYRQFALDRMAQLIARHREALAAQGTAITLAQLSR